MKLLYALPVVRNNRIVTVIALAHELTDLQQTIGIAAATTVELPTPKMPEDVPVPVFRQYEVKCRNYVTDRDQLELILAPLHVCGADVGQTEIAIGAYFADGWKYHQPSWLDGASATWHERFVEAVPGVPGLSEEVRDVFGAMLSNLFGGDDKKPKKGKKDKPKAKGKK